MPKKLKGGPLGFFNIHSVVKHQKIEWGPFGNFFSKSLSAEKTERGDPFSLSWPGMLRGTRGKTFLVQFARPNDSIWDHKFF